MLHIKNGQATPLSALKDMRYEDFYKAMLILLRDNEHRHCVSYFAYPVDQDHLRFIACVADDLRGDIALLAHTTPRVGASLRSLTAEWYPLHVYEREIWENYGVDFQDHPWLKPLRFPWDRHAQDQWINDYPFYKIQNTELHEVGVGPIHAGVIEPGHFRFQCNGEMVLHLEIQLGWQHRGVEALFLRKPKVLQRTVLAESIAGDTAVGHALTYARATEALAQISPSPRLSLERSIALELERMAMHTFDLSNLCTGMAYQLGNAVLGALRTPLINYFQWWCGNRFGKGLIRVGGSHFGLNPELVQRLTSLLDDFEKRFVPMAEQMFKLPSIILRMDDIGTLSKKQMYLIGAVGMTARMAGLKRDLRWSHPSEAHEALHLEPVLQTSGDVWARACMRRDEIMQSLGLLRTLLREWQALKDHSPSPQPLTAGLLPLAPDHLVVSLTEAWRGEIAHVLLTNAQGELAHYKVKDPSLHNWMALALALRHLEISDFPINNKSFDLSYCGHDL